MGQKIIPTGIRLGIVEEWRSNWYANKKDFGRLLIEDEGIRNHIKVEYGYAGISRVDIERTADSVTVKLYTARPGLVIGRKGAKVDKLRDDLGKITGKEVHINIQEVKKPERVAQLVAEEVASQLERRSAFRRTLKRSLETTMQAGVKGCKIQVSGRLGGSDMSRRETVQQGSIPLQTLSAHIDYGFAIAKTSMGVIGVKCWIYDDTKKSTKEEQG